VGNGDNDFVHYQHDGGSQINNYFHDFGHTHTDTVKGSDINQNDMGHDNDGVLQSVAVCCSLLQSVAACGSVQQCAAVFGSVLQSDLTFTCLLLFNMRVCLSLSVSFLSVWLSVSFHLCLSVSFSLSKQV